MNDYIIHDYIDNRSDLINYLNSIKYRNPHFLASDVEDGHLANYDFINNVILIAKNNLTNLSGNTYNFAGLFRRILSNLRIHSFFCNNTHHGLFKSLNNNDCSFFKKGTFDYLSENPKLIKDNSNLFFEINSGVKMNTEVAFRYHDHDLNIININLINMYKNHVSCSSLKNNIFFVKSLNQFFLEDFNKLPQMHEKYLALCDVEKYKSSITNKEFEKSVLDEPGEHDKVLPLSINGDKAKEIWKNTVDVLCSQESSYRHWLSETIAHDYNYQDQKFLVTCATTFCKEMIEERMKGDIEKLLSNQLDKEMELQVL